MNNLFEKATRTPTYFTDGVEIARTEPRTGSDAPFVGFIKTTIGEAEVPFSNKTLTETMMSGSKEISKNEYDSLPITVRNYI